MLELDQSVSISESEPATSTLDVLAEQKFQSPQLSETVTVQSLSLAQRSAICLATVVLGLTASLLFLGRASVWVSGQGKILPESSVAVQTAEPGIISRVFAKAGDRLTEKQPLAEVEPTQLNLDVSHPDSLVRMPVTGMIGQINTPGEQVLPGEVIAIIVPQNTPLIVSVAVSNEDIGFIRRGLAAQVKVKAYPYQQFGTVPARVQRILPNTNDAEHFTVILELLHTAILQGDRHIPLFSGLSVEAEIRIGEQRLFEFLL